MLGVTTATNQGVSLSIYNRMPQPTQRLRHRQVTKPVDGISGCKHVSSAHNSCSYIMAPICPTLGKSVLSRTKVQKNIYISFKWRHNLSRRIFTANLLITVNIPQYNKNNVNVSRINHPYLLYQNKMLLSSCLQKPFYVLQEDGKNIRMFWSKRSDVLPHSSQCFG